MKTFSTLAHGTSSCHRGCSCLQLACILPRRVSREPVAPRALLASVGIAVQTVVAEALTVCQFSSITSVVFAHGCLHSGRVVGAPGTFAMRVPHSLLWRPRGFLGSFLFAWVSSC